MDKEQAIELLEHLAWDRDIDRNLYGEALNMAIDALKAQLSMEDATKGATSDLIDRQQAIDVLHGYFDGMLDTDTVCPADIYGLFECIPSAQPEVLACGNGELVAKPEPQWILCDERMPEEHEWIGTKKFGTTISDEVYVTFENEKGERFCQHMKFQNGELSRYDQFHMDTWFKGSKPIAWTPLPEPYKPNKK